MTDPKRLEGVDLGFVSGALPEDEVRLRGVRGRERLSQLFQFDLLLARPEPFTAEELDALLSAPCAIAFGHHAGDVVHGILESIRLLDSARTVEARYIARLVPTFWLLTQARTSAIYQHLDVPGLARHVLSSYGFEDARFELLVSRTKKSPVHEYISQYQESDWDFLQRWFEHEGFFYWFLHEPGGEKLVVADENSDASVIVEPSTLSYRERNNLTTGGDATIWNLSLEQRRIPAHVALFDYNYRRPDTTMYASAVVDEARGFGSVFYYGEHFKDNDTGEALAKIRAERHFCERRVYTGRTDCTRFRVGHVFELENHWDAQHDGKYLITAIEHTAGYPVGAEEEGASQRYLASFEAIPYDVQFRPERRTPWPSIHGIMHAHIDADTDGHVAQLDSEGRYKVKLPYDVSGHRGTATSRWIRMAQPYAGPGYGAHHPLHKGTEVLVAHIDGDPDRPLIVGSVPNPATMSPSTLANATQSVTQTISGIRVEMEDIQP
jgi:type VI secretion system secreted protein VgrG